MRYLLITFLSLILLTTYAEASDKALLVSDSKMTFSTPLKTWQLPFAQKKSEIYLPILSDEFNQFKRDLLVKTFWSSSGETLAVLGGYGEIYFTLENSSYKNKYLKNDLSVTTKHGNGFIKAEDGNVYIPMQDFMSALGFEIQDFSIEGKSCKFAAKTAKLSLNESQGAYSLVAENSFPVETEIISSEKGFAEFMIKGVVKSDGLIYDGDFTEIDTRFEALTDGVKVSLSFPKNWVCRIYSPASSYSTFIDFMPDFPIINGYFPEEITEIVKEDESIKISASGAFQYFWYTEGKNFIIEFPKIQMSEDNQNIIKTFIDGVQTSYIKSGYGVTRLKIPISEHIKLSPDKSNSNSLIISKSKNATSLSGSGIIGTPQIRALVVIDPGHGGGDSGACNSYFGIAEKHLNLDLAFALGKYLEGYGMKVIYTRKTDRDVTWAYSPDRLELQARADVANFNQADIFLSVHCNASTSPSLNGFSVYWSKVSDYPLAIKFDRDFISPELDLAHRGVIKGSFYVLRNTKMPAIIIETAFVSNSSDAEKLKSKNFRDKIMKDVAEVVNEYIKGSR